MFNVQKVRKDFPILQRKVNGRPLIYFDNGATSQKPRQVIAAIAKYYEKNNANVHRGIHALAEEATLAYENSRKKIAEFVNAKSEKEIIFVRNTTEALNLVAYSWGRSHINSGDEVITTIMEHHSNFVPWQQLAINRKAKFSALDINDNGRLNFPKTYSNQLKILALTHASNVLGTVNPVKEIISTVRRSNKLTKIVVDGAQAVPHLSVDVQQLDCDFYAFSGHKMFGPMGIGVLYGKTELLEQMPPFLYGGGMIKSVTIANTEFAEVPDKFEAGTPNVAGAVGLAVAVDYFESVGKKDIAAYELMLTKKLLAALEKIKQVQVFGPKDFTNRVGVISFSVDGIHPHDVAQYLNDNHGIAVRAGHHCCMPLHHKLAVPASTRASLSFYNTEEEVETFVAAIKDLIKVFGS